MLSHGHYVVDPLKYTVRVLYTNRAPRPGVLEDSIYTDGLGGTVLCVIIIDVGRRGGSWRWQ